MKLTLGELRQRLLDYPGLPELAERMGTTRQTLRFIAKGMRPHSPAMHARIERALGEARTPPRPDRRLCDNNVALGEAWQDTETRGPTYRETMAAWGHVRNELERFARIPPHQRTSEDWAPAEATLRAWERLERPPVRYGSDTDEVVKLQRRIKRRQREGLVPSVIYRDHDEESWSPTPDELQMRMIDRAEFEAWPATVPAARPTARRPPPPPRGDLARHTDPSPRLTEVLEELRELRLRRLILVIIRAATTDPAVAQALHHLRAQAARLRRQQTRQHHHARRARADESPPAAPRRQAPRR